MPVPANMKAGGKKISRCHIASLLTEAVFYLFIHIWALLDMARLHFVIAGAFGAKVFRLSCRALPQKGAVVPLWTQSPKLNVLVVLNIPALPGCTTQDSSHISHPKTVV